MPRNFKGFGSGSNSNGQFWYGSQTNFPGFLYKKNVGVGARRSTMFAAGGNIICNQETYLYNKYNYHYYNNLLVILYHLIYSNI